MVEYLGVGRETRTLMKHGRGIMRNIMRLLVIVMISLGFTGCNVIVDIMPGLQEFFMNPEYPKDFTTNLPILTIDSHGKTIPNDPKIYTTIEVYENEFGELNEVINYDEVVGPSTLRAIFWSEVRGASSAYNSKHSFSCESRDEDCDDIDITLLGMGPEEDWVLYGPYKDKSLIRNALVYALSNEIGHWAPQTVFIEVIKNGQYQGVYVAMEKIKIDETRISPEENEFILEITSGVQFDGRNDVGFRLPAREKVHTTFTQLWETMVRTSYPKSSKISDDEFYYLKDLILNFDDLIYEGNYQHPTEGYSAYIDVDSFIDYLILAQLCKNSDFMERSTYFYITYDGLIKMGSPWDYNTSFKEAGFGPFLNIAYEGWHSEGRRWMGELMKDYAFRVRFADRWKELTAEGMPLNINSIEEKINDMSDCLNVGGAAGRNEVRWPEQYRKFLIFFGENTTQRAEAEKLKVWFREVIAWTDANVDELYSEDWSY